MYLTYVPSELNIVEKYHRLKRDAMKEKKLQKDIVFKPFIWFASQKCNINEKYTF